MADVRLRTGKPDAGLCPGRIDYPGAGSGPLATATIVGVPTYLNGYAVLPLVSGLIGQGMLPGAGMAFLVAGGVTSIPAAIAVFALVRRPVFMLYVAFGLTGSFASGLLYQLWLA